MDRLDDDTSNNDSAIKIKSALFPFLPDNFLNTKYRAITVSYTTLTLSSTYLSLYAGSTPQLKKNNKKKTYIV